LIPVCTYSTASLFRMFMKSIRVRLSGYIQQLQCGTDCTLCLVSRSRLHAALLHCYCNIQNYRFKLLVGFEFESPFHNACPSLLVEECRKLSRLANKFYCVSLTPLLHSYAIPGNSSKLERATCRNPGRLCGQHDFYYI